MEKQIYKDNYVKEKDFVNKLLDIIWQIWEYQLHDKETRQAMDDIMKNSSNIQEPSEENDYQEDIIKPSKIKALEELEENLIKTRQSLYEKYAELASFASQILSCIEKNEKNQNFLLNNFKKSQILTLEGCYDSLPAIKEVDSETKNKLSNYFNLCFKQQKSQQEKQVIKK